MTYLMLVSAFLGFGAGLELGLYAKSGDRDRMCWCGVYLCVLATVWIFA